MELVSLESDSAKKLVLMEQFLTLFPKSDPGITVWVYSELQDRYRRAGALDKALTAGERILRDLGFVATTVSAELGIASAIKLCRSVIIKGLESLVVESFTAARAFGVEQQVLASLQETYPQFDWEKQGDYLFSRVIQHGKRRAEEMRASAEMIDASGVGGVMAGAAAIRQAGVAAGREAGAFDAPTTLKPWRDRADEILEWCRVGKPGKLLP